MKDLFKVVKDRIKHNKKFKEKKKADMPSGLFFKCPGLKTLNFKAC